jgi:hypothetical protein
MTIIFIPFPGRRERHLQRQYQNILFPQSRREFDQRRVDGARYMDAQETEKFIADFQILVEKVTLLKPNEDSETILLLKEQLDKSYEQCCALAGEQKNIKAAIVNLVQLIMRAVWRGAEGDLQAIKNLQEEELARSSHYQLLECPLVVDLLDPDSLIHKDELVATFLSESQQAVQAALQLFDREQLLSLFQDALSLLEKTRLEHQGEQQDVLAGAWKNLQLIKQALS